MPRTSCAPRSTSILANLELLQERLDATERRGEEGEMIDSALRSSRRMSHLVSDLLLLARADAGRTGARRECDLAAVAAAALSEVRPVANGHRLTLADHGPVPVDGNPDELHRLTVNLLDNGLRHTPAGTEIRVAVERRNGDAVLEVSDDGPGIPPGMESQVFSRFVRGAGPADVAGDGGAGLGLAIVKAVAMSHGGDVDAGSSPRRWGPLHGAAAAAEAVERSRSLVEVRLDLWQARVLGIVYTIPILSPWTRQPTRRGHPPTPPRRVNVGQSEPSDPPVFPLPDAGGSVFSRHTASRLRAAADGDPALGLHLGADLVLVCAAGRAPDPRRSAPPPRRRSARWSCT